MKNSTEGNSRETPHLKRRGSAKKMPQAKRFRPGRKSPATKGGSPNTTVVVPMQWEEQIKRFDTEDPVHENRMQHRRKMIQKGKNTAGYDNYVQQVPKQKRIPRSMETPSTPDPTQDISNKRFLGQVRAWRVALHKYDPPGINSVIDAQSIGDCSTEEMYQTPCKSNNQNATPANTEDSPISIMSDSSRRDLNNDFEATVPRPYLITGASNWADDSDDDVDELL